MAGKLLGTLLVLASVGPLGGCGVREDIGSAAPDTVASSTFDASSVATQVLPTTSPLESTTVLPTITEAAVVDTAVPTTAIEDGMVSSPPVTMVAAPVISDASVRALAAVLGVEGELEQRDGEYGAGQCVGRLERRALCVNVPLWGLWQYSDLDAQDTPGASDDAARNVAVDLFTRLGVDPGSVISVEPNGPLPQVTFSSGAVVMVAADDRIGSVIAATSLLPPG